MLALQVLDLEAHLLAQVRVEVAEGLVQQQHLGVGHQGPGQGHALLLAAGELRGIALPEGAQPHLVQHALYRGLGMGWRFRPELERVGRVGAHSEVRPDRVVLEDHAQVPGLGRHIRTPARDEPPADVDLPGVQRLEARHQAQQHGFAAARGAQQREALAILHGEAQVLQDPLGPVGLGHAFD